jgi:hypothetical protein
MKLVPRSMFLCIAVALISLSGPFLSYPEPAAASTVPAENALSYLRQVMDRYTAFYVYADKYAVANHFVPSGWMGDYGDISLDEAETRTFHRGGNSIRITYQPKGFNGWAGIYWQTPANNWGTVAGAGFNLQGVQRLTFWARGQLGGEKAEFLVGGIAGQYGDSLQPARRTAILTLSSEWQQYTIDLQGANLRYVIGGFGWVTSRVQNPQGATIYIDDIRFEGLLNKPRLLESYETVFSNSRPQPLLDNTYVYVYQDGGASVNSYADTGLMGDYGDIQVNGRDTSAPRSGATAYRVHYSAAATQRQQWAGIYWQSPEYNWGDRPGGYNLTAAARLTFWAKGAVGGERLEFFIGGITGQFYDTVQPKRTTGIVTLGTTWQQFVINLNGVNLARVIGGFGFAIAKQNNLQGATFYLDDIRYERVSPAAHAVFIPPPSSPDAAAMLAAHSYDNALAILAFLASGTPGDLGRARILADSLVWVQNHDSARDGRVRNVYYADELSANTPSGLVARYNNDLYGSGTTAGNAAWVMLAWLNYYQKQGGIQYLNAAKWLGEWIQAKTNDPKGPGGYTGGVPGWGAKYTYKSTEHNLDIYVAFMKLYELTHVTAWRDRALHAKRLVQAMWNSAGKCSYPDATPCFYTGTTPDGVTINKEAYPLDVNTWGFLALGQANWYGHALDFVKQHHCATDVINGVVFEGFDFDTGLQGGVDGIWWEGTGQMVTALWARYYFSAGKQRQDSYTDALKFSAELRKAQIRAPRANGRGIVATTRERVWTGFNLPAGGKWYYYNRLHVGATAWFIFAELQYNPFWGIPANVPIPYQGAEWANPVLPSTC